MVGSNEVLKKISMTIDDFFDNIDNNLYGFLKSQLMKIIVFSYNNISYMDRKYIIFFGYFKKNFFVLIQVIGIENCNVNLKDVENRKFKGFRGEKILENLV